MAYTTKYSIAEQVLLRIKGGRPDLSTKVDIRDLIAMIPQIAAAEMKAGYFNQTLPTGETIPDGLMLATFTIPVTHGANTSTAELPARPIGLPRGMGVFAIMDETEPLLRFIPALPGQMMMLDSQPFLSDLGTIIVFEVIGGNVKFKKVITQDTLTCQMFLADISGVSDTEPIPITQDIELAIVDKLFERFAPHIPANKDNDLLTDNKV
jgi:hypothetical protein